ncbi:endonuclease/exonuclease/phosphatase family protein [uncultured Kriegella sp.]|uniref:endonuclease/exonuclease/phosphatase family protein n=1 Tax=uncultured Kriegella sp. TaxID=1798910 RepID=UPI0030DB410D|tara:strand:- start:35911 stop:36756 length:846 start_codon:yes stop_codon:yes gene_type:complete
MIRTIQIILLLLCSCSFSQPLGDTKPNDILPKAKSLKVLNWNVLYQFNHKTKISQGSNWIKSKQPNVVALQELNGLSSEGFQEMASRWNHAHAILLKEEGFAMGLTSDRPIEVIEKQVKGFHHGYLHVKSYDIHFFVVHLWPSEFYETEIISAKIKEQLDAGNKVILLGDFNAESPLDAAYLETKPKIKPDFKVLTTYLDLGLIDVIHKNNTKALVTNPSPLVIPKWQPDLTAVQAQQRRIDFILASPNLSKQSKKSLIFTTKKVEKISDHYPMLVNFKFP